MALYQRHPDWPAAEREHALQVLADVLTDQEDWTPLEALVQKRVESVRTRLPADSPELAGALAEATRALLTAEKFAEAEPLARECLAIRERQLPDDWRTFNIQSFLGASLLGQKQFDQAEPLLLSGYEGMKAREEGIPPAGKPRLKEAIQRLVQLYEETNRPEKASEWKRKLEEF